MFHGTETGSKLVTAARGIWFTDVPRNWSRRYDPLQGAARFILKNVPPNEFVYVRDIGFPGYLGMNPVWDIAGLVTRSAARVRHDTSDEAWRVVFEELATVRPGCFWLNVDKARA